MTANDSIHLQAQLKRLQGAFDRDRYPSLADRRDRIGRIGKMIIQHKEDFCAALSRDFGHRSVSETTALELAPLMGSIRHTRAHLRRWMRPEHRGRSLEFLQLKNWVQYQPLGVVGIMVPWNYPILLSLGPLIDVLAAGNRAMIKPSEMLPETARLLGETISEFFSPDEVTVINGDIEVAEAFSRLPFDHLFFTGSTSVGRKVMAAAAENLTPLTLELGGKSPAIVAGDYPINRAARDLAFGKLMNAGQTCIAPDYVLAPRESIEALATAIIDQAKAFYPVASSGADYSGMVGERSFLRLSQAIADCRRDGARVLSHDDVLSGAGRRIPPTVILDPPPTSSLLHEEIFGPVLPILPYDRLEDAIAYVNARLRPLALYIFSSDRSSRRKILEQTHSGNVTINGTLLHIAQNDLPFGGIGPSGLGAYHGKDGFRRFSHARGIAQVRLFNPARLAMPPYGRIAELLQRFLMRLW